MKRLLTFTLVLLLVFSAITQDTINSEMPVTEKSDYIQSSESNQTNNEIETNQSDDNGNSSSGNDSVVQNNTLEYNLSDEISIECNMVPDFEIALIYKNLGSCEINQSIDYEYIFTVNPTSVTPMFEDFNTSEIQVVTNLHDSIGTNSDDFVYIYSNQFENMSFSVEFEFNFTLADDNLTNFSKTAVLNVFEIGADCESTNFSQVTLVHSEINCNLTRIDTLENQTISVEIQVNESFEEQYFSFNMSVNESKSILLVLENSSVNDFQNVSYWYEIEIKLSLMNNNSTEHLSSYIILQDTRYDFGMNPDWELNLSGVGCDDVAVHLGIFALGCLFEDTSPSYDYNETNSTVSEPVRPNDVEQKSVPGFLAANAILAILVVSFAKRKIRLSNQND